jgi:predicted MFS family arabinose efflux permease
MSRTTPSTLHSNAERLPLGGLLALAMTSFITLLTEIMPAGLLSSIANGLSVSESLAGQFITYSVGALVAAIPVTVLTQGMRRRPLLLFSIFGFAVVNLITALSRDFSLSLITRFIAGVFGGLVWSLMAGYAVRMSPSHLSGRAIAISGGGGTVALVLGVPLGTLLGRYIGWQAAFGLMSVVALLLTVWVLAIVPDFAGQSEDQRRSLAHVLQKGGIRAVLFVVFTYVGAHNMLYIYIYIEPLIQPSGLASNVDVVLFTFGLGSISGVWLAGTLVDRRLRFLAVAIWGLAVGGFATITQTALSRLSGESVDVAQSFYTTGWNLAVATGGLVGGILLDRAGSASLPWVAISLIAAAFLGTVFFMNRKLALKH